MKYVVLLTLIQYDVKTDKEIHISEAATHKGQQRGFEVQWLS